MDLTGDACVVSEKEEAKEKITETSALDKYSNMLKNFDQE